MSAEDNEREPLVPLFGGKTGWDLIRSILLGLLYWGALAFVYTVCFVSLGALTGAVLFVGVGMLAGMDYTPGEMAVSGFRNGGFFMLMWAPGLAMVLCMIQARRRWERRNRPALSE